MNKYEQLTKWLSTYPPLHEWMYFNTITDIEGQIGVNTIDSEEYSSSFISGGGIVDFMFNVIMIKSYDTGTSLTNTEAIAECENFMAWLNIQNSLKNYPQFSEQVLSVEVMQNIPTLALINADNQTAKYNFLVKITYLKEY